MIVSGTSHIDAPRLVVAARDPQRRAEAKAWADAFHYRFVDSASENFSPEDGVGFVLCFNADAVELEWCRRNAPSPLRVDFIRGSVGHRLRSATVRQELLARSVGLLKSRDVRVLDATAGLGRDGVMLAMLGCDVTLVERAPWMARLLEDGLQRALTDANAAARLEGRIRLRLGDCRDVMRSAINTNARYDVVYLDPMFPESTQSAMPAKAMQALQGLLDEPCDGKNEAEMLEIAMACARRRVVVKRPRLGPALAGCEPTYALSGKACRFDVYQLPGEASTS